MGVYTTFRASPVPSVGFAALSTSFLSTAQTPTSVSLPPVTTPTTTTANNNKAKVESAPVPTGPSAAGTNNPYLQSKALESAGAGPLGGWRNVLFGVGAAVGATFLV